MSAHSSIPRAAGLLRAAAAALLLLFPAVVPAGDAAGQTTGELGRAMRLPMPPTHDYAARGSRGAPAITIGIPSAYGADWRDAAVGFGFQATTRLRDRPDGVVAVAFGIGDAHDMLGLETVITSYGTARSCCRGGISLKLHRVLPADFGVAVGYENGVVWGPFDSNDGSATDAGSSVYGVVSKVFYLRKPAADPYRMLTFTLGVGNGRFRSEDDIIADRENINVFGGAAARLSRRFSVVADWTGQDLAAGLSVLPFRRHAFVVLPGVADLTTKPRFIMGAAYGFDYTSLFR